MTRFTTDMSKLTQPTTPWVRKLWLRLRRSSSVVAAAHMGEPSAYPSQTRSSNSDIFLALTQCASTGRPISDLRLNEIEGWYRRCCEAQRYGLQLYGVAEIVDMPDHAYSEFGLANKYIGELLLHVRYLSGGESTTNEAA